MRDLIKIDMEYVGELKDLFKRWTDEQGYELEYCEVYDDECGYLLGENEQFEPFKHLWLTFKFVDDEEEEDIAFERTHKQYNFEEDKLYGFYEVVQSSANKKIDSWDFACYMAEYSRKNLIE